MSTPDAGVALVSNPTPNTKLTVIGLSDAEAGPPRHMVSVKTDDGHLANITTFTQVGVSDDTFYVEPDTRNVAHTHTEAIEAIEAAGGEVVDSADDTPRQPLKHD